MLFHVMWFLNWHKFTNPFYKQNKTSIKTKYILFQKIKFIKVNNWQVQVLHDVLMFLKFLKIIVIT